MPVRLSPRTSSEPEARIEIIPLIDIMFFLLAAFMLVSLSMVHSRTIPVNLPTATTAATDVQRDVVSLNVDAAGNVFMEGKPVAPNELSRRLAAARAANPAVRVSIGGDRDARHGEIMRALDLVRAAGIDRVAFELRTPDPSPRP